MKYRVNNACIGCGFCASTCPEIFEMNDDRRAVAADREVPPELESAAEEAFTGCLSPPLRRWSEGASMLKNIPQNEALLLTELIPYQAGQVVSRTLSQNPHVSVTLFAFDKGEEISTHDSDGDALALGLKRPGPLHGRRQSSLAGAGRMCSHAAQKPHALYAEDAFQMLLVVVFPE